MEILAVRFHGRLARPLRVGPVSSEGTNVPWHSSLDWAVADHWFMESWSSSAFVAARNVGFIGFSFNHFRKPCNHPDVYAAAEIQESCVRESS